MPSITEFFILAALVIIIFLLIPLVVQWFKGDSKNLSMDLIQHLYENQKQTVQLLEGEKQQLGEVMTQQKVLTATLDQKNETQFRDLQRQVQGIVKEVEVIKHNNAESLRAINAIVTEKMQGTLNTRLNGFSGTMTKSISDLGNVLATQQKNQDIRTIESLDKLSLSFQQIQKDLNQGLLNLKNSNADELSKLRAENQKSLDEINGTVNEKLQKTLDEKLAQSFETVSNRLKEVYEGLGEMKEVASGVKDLKNVLSNVKNRGTLGEIQLEAILEDILTPQQYEKQFQIIPNKQVKVDFAIKLPGTGENPLYLPIDSKFPGDSYQELVQAYEVGDTKLIKQKQTLLKKVLNDEAKDIQKKYVSPPYTTNFAILFLPFEGLYSEAVRLGLVEELQRKYQVNITGPSTMAAMLNSLQMGFQTLAIQKKSSEIWQTLGAAKMEFQKFTKVLEKAQTRINQANDELNSLLTTRTRAINRKLESVSELPDTSEANHLLGLSFSDDDE
ncbi:MAG: DNA recombination protein RmuC [Allobaculum sp.]|nr:DNA recombination protein RmuC [Allobaculum sp.]